MFLSRHVPEERDSFITRPFFLPVSSSRPVPVCFSLPRGGAEKYLEKSGGQSRK